MPEPLQIIATGDADTDFFVLNEDNLNSIIAKIPKDAKVSIVSVVGAFRTGKSFLLNFFLRFLRHPKERDDLTEAWMYAEGSSLSEGNMNEHRVQDSPSTVGSSDGWNLVEGEDVVGTSRKEPKISSFQWRGGKERQTTGIWMWSEPFVRQSEGGEKIAILLMDTQGMFDNETSMTLTAQIFGLSTLVSSFQIYNVDKRIQEDNLQHLALFSEYGRMALLPPKDKQKGQHILQPAGKEILAAAAKQDAHDKKVDTLKNSADTSVKVVQSEAESNAGPMTKEEVKESSSDVEEEKKEEMLKKDIAPQNMIKPFQHLQFLVRDWQNFDTDFIEPRPMPAPSTHTVKLSTVVAEKEGDDRDVKNKEEKEAVNDVDVEDTAAAVTAELEKYEESAEEKEMFESLKQEMDVYLKEVLSTRGLSDLQSTRDQILRCFEALDCYLLPHPGGAVTRKTYDGTIASIDPFFRTLMNRYVREVFGAQLQPKIIAGRKLTGSDLKTYFEVYVKMFQAGQKSFPKAMTLLDATSEANNRTAFDGAYSLYRTKMDNLVGPESSAFVKEVDLVKKHELYRDEAVAYFQDGATMGAEATIAHLLATLRETIEGEKTRYFATNALRNPFRDVEMYILPIGIAIASWFLAVFVDKTCSTDFCETTEGTFRNIYMFIFIGLVVIMWRQIRGGIIYVKEFVIPALLGGAQASGAGASSGAGAGTTSRSKKTN